MPNKKTRQQQTKTQETSYIAASAKQLADIQSLQISIDRLIQQLNRPYSTIASIIIFPVIAEGLIFHKHSPFHKLYEELNKYYYDSFLKNWEPVKNLFNEVDVNLTKNRDMVIDRLYSLRNVNEFNLEKNPDLSLDVILERIDDLEKQTGPWQEGFIRLKRLMIYVYNLAMIQFQKFSHKIPLDINNTNQYKFKDLYSLMEREYSYYTTAIPTIMQNASDQDAKENAMVEMNKWMILSKVFLVMLGQNLIVNPLLMKLFPNGIGQPAIPKVNTQTWFDKKNAEQIISLLENHKKYLSKKANRNVKISRYLSALLVPLAFFLLANEEYPSAETIIIAISLIATALTNLKVELQEAYAHYTFQNVLKKQYQKVKNMLSSFDKLTIQAVDSGTLKASYISIYSPDKALAKIIRTCLVFHKVKIMSYSEKSIMIPTDAPLNLTTVKAIRELSQKIKERIAAIKKLKNQVSRLQTLLNINEFTIIPAFNKQMLPFCTIEFYLPKHYENFFAEKFKGLFSENQIAIIEDGSDKIQITLAGYSAADQNQFEDFEKTSKSSMSKERTPDISNEYVPSSFFQQETPFKKHKGKKNVTIKNEKTSETKPTITQERRIVRWKQAGLYDSSDEKCAIHPLNSGHVHSNNSLSQSKIFTKNELDQEIFPDVSIFNALCEIIEVKPHIVPRKGHPGLVYASGMERDRQGRWFQVSLKAKMISHSRGKGDVRAYAEAEVNEKDETVHVFKGIKFHSHDD